jgi:Family of unknown function (DUF5309)
VAVPTNTGQTYNYNTIREDLSDYVYKISPLECPGLQAVGRKGKWENTYHEWPVVQLASANGLNAQVEGQDAVNDAPTVATRHGNYSQIMTKVKQQSSTDEVVRGAGDVQRMAKQILYGTQEIKRDMEARLMGPGSYLASSGSASVARTTAAVAAFIGTSATDGYETGTNVSRGAAGANGTLSAAPNGYPNGAETAGTPRTITETMFKSVIQGAWTNGGNPDLALVPPTQKVNISAFTGNATRFKKAEDKKLIAAIDVYDSDFGEIQVVPDRFMDTTRVLLLDRELVEVGWLQGMRNEPLAKTGLSVRRMISCEWGVVVGAEKGLGMVCDLQ